MSNLKLDFVVYLGDPDQGAPTLPSGKVLEKIEEHKSKLSFSDGVYAAITVEKNGRQLADKKPDPVMQLMTAFVRAIPFVIDGEPEQALLSESEFGFLFEPTGGELFLSYFAGDAYEPDEYLVEHESIGVEQFADQVCAMADRLVSIIKKVDPDLIVRDDYAKTFVEILDLAKSRLKSLRLERERGLRR
ncbi:hypothetical protein L6R52_32855 [Myxococcota bacterium]|nr:hypothetical protein [Myxococcota bacterium]